MGNKYVIGVDLGGTKISTGIMSRQGDILGKAVTIPTDANKPRKKILGNIKKSINTALNSAKITIGSISGVGIGSPGPLDIERGIILTPQNLPNLHYCNIKQEIQSVYSLPVYANNDANCFVLGECCFGAGKGAKIACGLTLGTGLGCGIVINGKIFAGATDTAAEIWCSPYLNGNFEDYISGRGIQKIYKNKSLRIAYPAEIAKWAEGGDVDAKLAWNEFGKHLGFVLSYIVNLIDPELIILGGSISNAYELFYQTMEKSLRENINPRPRETVKVVKAKLGDISGVIGAASLALSNIK